MFKHIVTFRLLEEAKGATKAENIEKLKEMLEALPAKIADLKGLEVGVDLLNTAQSADVVLITEFEDEAAFTRYVQHPDHQKVIAFLQCVLAERRAVDYIV